MEDDNQKNPKSTIINVFGTKYKATHIKSSSINNKILLSLAQIKYFINFISKKSIKIYHNYILPIISYIVWHVLDNEYSELIIIIFTTLYIVLAVLYPISNIISDTFVLTNEFTIFNTLIFKQIMLNSIKHVLYSIFVLYLLIIVTLILIFCLLRLFNCLKYVFLILCKALQQITNLLLENINKLNKQIPNIEFVDQMEEV